MTVDELRALLESRDLNLLSIRLLAFGVSLRVPTQFGLRIQTGAIGFASRRAFEAATTEEVVAAIDELYKRLSKASQTQQGVVKEGLVIVGTEQAVIAEQVGIKYPAH